MSEDSRTADAGTEDASHERGETKDGEKQLPSAKLDRMHSMECSPPPRQKGRTVPVIHRASSMPLSPQSTLFYRNKEMSKSSRSIRFDLAEEDDDESGHGGEEKNDEEAPVMPVLPPPVTGAGKWHHRADSAPVPCPLFGYPGTSPGPPTETEESQQFHRIAFDDGLSRQVPVDESLPLLSGRQSIDDVEHPQPTGPSVPKKPGGGILRQRPNGYDRKRRLAEERRLTRMAAAFLTDYSSSQAPTLPPDSDYVTEGHLHLHSLRFSAAWKVTLSVATACLFLASCYEGGDGDDDWQTYDDDFLSVRIRRRETMLLILTFIPVLVFSVDMVMMSMLFGRKYKRIKRAAAQSQSLRFTSGDSLHERGVKAQAFVSNERSPAGHSARKSRSWIWAFPLSLFLIALSIETIFVVMTQTIMQRRIWSSAFKPLVFFYSSSRSRNALDAMNRVARIVFRVIFIELFLIFSFAAVACQLYGEEYASFSGLPISFLSMFQLSTTVVNPSMWMQIYDKSPPAASFFIIFLVVSVFYLHSLVLSVVFKSYIDGMRIIREHAEIDREKALELAFETLFRIDGSDKEDYSDRSIAVSCRHIERVLMIMRPHYRDLKIQTLMNIVDPGQDGSVDFNTFRLKVPKALNTSVKSARPYNALSRFLDVFAAFVAVANLLYVVLASSSNHAPLWEMAIIPTGLIITMLGILELLIRLIPVKMYRIAEAAKPSLVFDGFSICASLVSLVALALHEHGLEHKRSLNYLFTGRAIDMLRCLRLNKEARGIVKRSSEVLPTLIGPLVLLMTSTHIFTYVGMSIWGGEVVCDSNPSLTPFYDRNNFNSYVSGLITMFQVLVVNDWHAIAEVFILPHHISMALVYPFFILANIINVSVLLNTMIAFFVGAFVTRASGPELVLGDHKLRASAVSLRKGVLSSSGTKVSFEDDDASDSSNDDFTQLVTVSVRQGFDNIMRTVAGEDDDDEEDAAELCSHILELFESLSPATEKVGYLVSCQQSKSRFGNRRFQKLIHEFMDNRTMHGVVSVMHSELATLPDGHKRTVRQEFTNKQSNETLEISASLLEEGSSVSLFVARTIDCGAS